MAGEEVHVAALPEWSPELEYIELGSPADVRGLTGPPAGADAAYVWAWIDEDAGTIRARCFIEEAGIAEDEATGSAAIVLADRLARPVTIHQGRGSVLAVRPLADGLVEVGGGVRLDEVRDHPV
jgi:predicted PhzF superfamily epimerase YddE/YHI9